MSTFFRGNHRLLSATITRKTICKTMKNMTAENTIKTQRLLLRQWGEEDLEPFAAMNADPRVMEYFPSVKSLEESREEYEAILEQFKNHDYGWWAISVIDGPDFIGVVGLKHVNFEAPFTPAVEIGWRLQFDYWGKGYATEGALASLKYGFETLKLKEVVSFTAVQNMRSRAVMERIGMHHDPKDDFDHPRLPEGHLLRRHVLYRIRAPEWQPITVRNKPQNERP